MAGRVQYGLRELVVMAVCAVLVGADNWVEVAQWSAEHLAWLRERLHLKLEMAPAHDTFGWVRGQRVAGASRGQRGRLGGDDSRPLFQSLLADAAAGIIVVEHN